MEELLLMLGTLAIIFMLAIVALFGFVITAAIYCGVVISVDYIFRTTFGRRSIRRFYNWLTDVEEC